MESKDPECLLSVRIVLGEIELSPMECGEIPPQMKLSETFGGLVNLRLGPETIASGVLCLHGGGLAVRVVRIAHLPPGVTSKPVASILESGEV